MEIFELCLSIALGVIIFTVYILLLIAWLIERKVFVRYDYDKRLKYFSPSEFDLQDEKVELGDLQLNCHIYRGQEGEGKKKVVIFCHGIGAGHLAYTKEIAYLVKAGYIVIAADNYGCGESGGKRSGGFDEGIYAAEMCYDYVKNSDKFEGYKVYLVGHSWGAYSAMCASRDIAVDGVVALSGFNSPSRTLSALISGYGVNKAFSKIMMPCFFFVNATRSGRMGNMVASKSLKESGVRALVMHGIEDYKLPLSLAAATCELGGNAEVVLLEGKGHNVYNTVKAEKKLAELGGLLMDKNATEAEFKAFDFEEATEQDEEIMSKIVEFLDCEEDEKSSEEGVEGA